MIKNISSNTTLIGQTIIAKTVPWVSVSFLEPRQDSVIMSAMEIQLDYHGAWQHWSSQELTTYWQAKKGQEGQSTIESWTELLNHLVKLVPTEQEHGEINRNVNLHWRMHWQKWQPNFAWQNLQLEPALVHPSTRCACTTTPRTYIHNTDP